MTPPLPLWATRRRRGPQEPKNSSVAVATKSGLRLRCVVGSSHGSFQTFEGKPRNRSRSELCLITRISFSFFTRSSPARDVLKFSPPPHPHATKISLISFNVEFSLNAGRRRWRLRRRLRRLIAQRLGGGRRQRERQRGPR